MTLLIREYCGRTIADDVESIVIERLYNPLNNIPLTVNKIIIKKQINVFKREHTIPLNCTLVIENTV